MNRSDGETIGLIAATRQESAALLRCVTHWKRIPAPRRCFTFMVAGNSCVLITSGMGMRRASEAARFLVEMSTPQLLVSFGIAGAVGADLEVGDVVLPETTFLLNQGNLSAAIPLEPWPESAREAANQALANQGRHLYTGTAITTSGAQVMESQLGGLQHPILEMETAGIASVAAEKGIPLRALRAISDGPRAPIPIDIGEVMDADANLQAGKLLKAIIRNPMMIFQSRQLMQNVSLAADNAAIALMAALSQ